MVNRVIRRLVAIASVMLLCAAMPKAADRSSAVSDKSNALGQSLLAAGHAAEAIPHLRRGFDAGIEIPQGGYDLAVALQKTGDMQRALAVVQRIRPVENDAEAWLRVGRLAVELRGPVVAEQFFRRAVAIRPEDASGHQQLGLNLLVLHRYEEAARELGEAVRLDPRHADGLSRLAYCELEPRTIQRRACTSKQLSP